jgi:hypothetical protein
MMVGLVNKTPNLSFWALSLKFSRGRPEAGSRWSARREARTNDLVRRRGSSQPVFREKAQAQRRGSRKHPFGPPIKGRRARMTMESGLGCSLKLTAVSEGAMCVIERTQAEAFSHNWF